MESPSRWKNNGLPRKGWSFEWVEDFGEPSRECSWCGTSIRYGHYLSHPEVDTEYLSGCVCCEHLTEDYVNPKLREKGLKKRQTWIESSKWQRSAKGSWYRKDCSVLIYLRGDRWLVKIGATWGKVYYLSVLEAQERIWKVLNP